MRMPRQHKKFLVSLAMAIFLVGVVYLAWPGSTHKDQPKTVNSKTVSASSPGFNKNQYSLTDPASIWVIVNKQHPLSPQDYAPTDLITPSVPLRVPGNESMQLRKVAASSLEQMFSAAKAQGLNLMLSSGYRSYTYQVSLYGGYVQSQGQAAADQVSARPGYSEHQTGLAADIEPTSKNCELEQCFETTPEGQWLAANAYKYGFILRYTADKVAVTGYKYEPWHYRYVGTDLTSQMRDTSAKTLEEFFDVTGGAVY
jgi:D-alanyl-D-alanine carboxypeptidase